jgi:hypothetical protein
MVESKLGMVIDPVTDNQYLNHGVKVMVVIMM